MRLTYKRFSVIAGFGALLAVLLIKTVLIRGQLAVQDSDQDRVQHTQDVQLELATIESLLSDAETGQRGYLYTGEARYLEPYNVASGQIETHIDRLAQLTADNPRQQTRISQLHALSREKIGELAQTIALYQSNKKNEARAVVLSDSGMRIMNEIRQLMSGMREDEDQLEHQRLNRVKSSTRALVATIYLTTALAIGGLALLAFFILRTMDQREKYAAELRQREEWFRVTLRSIGDAVIATDQNGIVTFINPIAEELTGVKLAQARGKKIRQVFPIFNEQTGSPVDNPVAKVLERGVIMGLANHTVLQRADGKRIPIEDSAAPIFDDRKLLRGVVMVFRDVTEEKLAQEMLRKAEKLAAAGRLAATVAHEINNPLEAVCNLIYISRHTPGVPDEAQSFLLTAEQELDRVSQITRQTLGFYRDTTLPASVDLCDIVEAAVKIYDNKLKSKNIRLLLDLATCPPVDGLQGELKQLVANLISNAADAVSDGGRIKISLRPAGAHGGVVIKIADDGPGVPSADSVRIFEPFYTTKQDVGTGLGLWVSRSIAERHGGSITVSDGKEDGLNGAVFTVLLTGIKQDAAVTGAA